MQRPHVLLDYDGVLLRSPTLARYQAAASARFVQRHTQLSLATCHEVNAKFYRTYGHTVSLLRQMLKRNVSLEEYNDFVFSRARVRRLAPLLTRETVDHFQRFEGVLSAESWSVFTNAHATWVTETSRMCGLPVDEADVIAPTSLEHLKPNPIAYERVEGLFPPDTRFVFADDSFENLVQRQRWTCLTFDGRSGPDAILRALAAPRIRT